MSYSKVKAEQIYLSQNANKVFNNAINELKNFGDDYVTIDMLLYCFLDESDSIRKLSKIKKINLKQAIMDLIKREKVTS